MACCLMTPSHYLDQWWLNEILHHLSKSNITGNAQDSSQNIFDNRKSIITPTSHSGQWVIPMRLGQVYQWFSARQQSVSLVRWQWRYCSLALSHLYTYHWPSTGSQLVQVMACHLLSAKSLPKHMLTDCQLASQRQTSVGNQWNLNQSRCISFFKKIQVKIQYVKC